MEHSMLKNIISLVTLNGSKYLQKSYIIKYMRNIVDSKIPDHALEMEIKNAILCGIAKGVLRSKNDLETGEETICVTQGNGEYLQEDISVNIGAATSDEVRTQNFTDTDVETEINCVTQNNEETLDGKTNMNIVSAVNSQSNTTTGEQNESVAQSSKKSPLQKQKVPTYNSKVPEVKPARRKINRTSRGRSNVRKFQSNSSDDSGDSSSQSKSRRRSKSYRSRSRRNKSKKSSGRRSKSRK